MYIHDVKKAQKCVKRDRRCNIFLLICCLFIVTPTLVATFIEVHALILMFLIGFFAGFLIAVFSIITNNRLLKQLSIIENNISLIKTYQVKAQSPKIAFLTHQEIHGRPRIYTPRAYGVTITDSNKNKYYYFFNEDMLCDQDNVDAVRSKFSEDITIECYENTKVVKSINKNTRYVRILGAGCR